MSELPRPKGGASETLDLNPLPPLRYGLPFIPMQSKGLSGRSSKSPVQNNKGRGKEVEKAGGIAGSP